MKTILDENYGKEKYEKLDWYLPETDEFDLMIWFHGGGLNSGSRKDVAFYEDLVKNNVGVCSVEYSMYPDAKFPEFIEDCAKAIKYCEDKVREYKNVKRIFVSGQSAGAYITLMLCLNKSYLEKVGADRNIIDGYISDSAQTTTHFNVLKERGAPSTYERIDDASPLFFVSPECDYKALLLICYENDMECRVTQNKLLYESLKRHYKAGKLKLEVLPGYHVNGSLNRNENGTFDFVDSVLRFISDL